MNTSLLLENISTLVTVCPRAGLFLQPDFSVSSAPPDEAPRRGAEMGDIGVLHNASILIESGRIVRLGRAGSLPNIAERIIDCRGKTVLPGFVDSHTHIAFAGDRADEFARRLRGATYQQIAESGGGILSSVRSVRSATIDEITEQARRLVRSAFRHGSTTIEIKSGYGLDTESELKLLEAIARLSREEHPSIIATFLGAHDVPAEFRSDRGAYVSEIIGNMLPAVARQGVAEFCDVFSDTGYFTPEESERILRAGMLHGLRPKIHADELSAYGGGELAARVGAISADHLLRISDEGIEQMIAAGVIATLLPGTAFFLGLPYAPARKMIDSGLPVALATDCNPGSNMCENMQMTLALACMGMKMTIEEAITAATINGAAAVGRAGSVGSIEPGKQADLLICNVPDYPGLVYHYGVNHVESVVVRGNVVV